MGRAVPAEFFHPLLHVAQAIGQAVRRALVEASGSQAAPRIHYLPALTQTDYDHLLWSCDLNLVRGEDSFVRAQWAGRPFLWQTYPQQDGVHAAKLAAFNRRFLESAVPELAASVGRAALDWNGLGAARGTTGDQPVIELPVPELWEAWRAHCRGWRARLEELPDLTASLRAFVQKGR